MIDLHTHTTFSDGTWSVVEMLEYAEKNGVTTLAITDHDRLGAHIELKKMDVSKYYSGRIIVGAEFGALFNNVKIELLGYNFNMDIVKKWLDEYYSDKNKRERLTKEYNGLVSRCKEQNILIEDTEYNPDTQSPYSKLYNEIRKYPENKKYFSDRDWDSLHYFYRTGTSNNKSLLYRDLSEEVPPASQISELIRSSGGKVFLAHLYTYELEDHIKFLDDLNSAGVIDGAEAYYPGYTDEQTDVLVKYCKEKGLFMSSGSDCHGENGRKTMVGTGHGNMNTPESVIENWI